MRDAIQELVKMGPIPAMDFEDRTLDDLFNRYADLLLSIERPVTDEEAKALLTLFGPDDAGEVVWTIIHIVETAPSWPMQEHLGSLPESPWIDTLIKRAKRGGVWK